MIARFTIFPVGRSVSLSSEVAKAVRIIEKSGLPYQLTAMDTELEGSWDAVMAVIKKCRDRLRRDNKRVYITIAIDDRKGARGRLKGKVTSVMAKVGAG